jgi:hypothetical protein
MSDPFEFPTCDLFAAVPVRLLRIATASEEAEALSELTNGVAVRLPDGSAWCSPFDLIEAVPPRFVVVSDLGEH